jgi:hypothetical protein
MPGSKGRTGPGWKDGTHWYIRHSHSLRPSSTKAGANRGSCGGEAVRILRRPANSQKDRSALRSLSHATEPPLTLWNVLDRARVPVNDHVVREPVGFRFSVLVDVGITDVHGAHILILN